MSTVEIRQKLHNYIDTSEDDIIAAVFAFFKTYNNKPKDVPLNIAEYNKDINDAMAEIDKGEFDTQEEVEALIKRRNEKINMV